MELKTSKATSKEVACRSDSYINIAPLLYPEDGYKNKGNHTRLKRDTYFAANYIMR